ncbi:hypothetical protein [Desulfosoma sp.]
MTPRPRFPIHLCQPDSKKSCAACCGIYNFKENGRRAVMRRLRRNTAILEQGGRETAQERFASHAQRWRHRDNGDAKRFQTIFNCEFVGFLDAEHRRVGCLLHPALHEGQDWRDCSFYGRELCDGHFCPSYLSLTEDEQAFVVETLDDWYLYGLVITDLDLVKGVYRHLSDRLGQAVPRTWLHHPSVRSALQPFWRWKVTWPYRRDGFDWFGKYLFIGDRYEEMRLPYELLGSRPSPYHPILLALGSVFRSLEELRDAERLIETALERAERAFSEDISPETP